MNLILIVMLLATFVLIILCAFTLTYPKNYKLGMAYSMFGYLCSLGLMIGNRDHPFWITWSAVVALLFILQFNMSAIDLIMEGRRIHRESQWDRRDSQIWI